MPPINAIGKFSCAKQAGFTLIEVIVGIVVLSISYAIFTSLIYPLAGQSAAQVHQIRAAELGQSMLNEILAKSFDEQSDRSGGVIRCGETLAPSCTLSANLGADSGETRQNFDDVDDYNSIDFGDEILNSTGESLADVYVGFSINIRVINDSDYSGHYQPGVDNNKTAKLITVTVRSPQGDDYDFSVYKANF